MLIIMPFLLRILVKKTTSSANTGVKRGCILNQLQHFHVTSNWVVDAMHDILEGVAPFELSLILEALNVSKYIELDIVNKEIKTFNFSIADMDSVPPTLSSFSSIKMSATEKWCFLRNLPLLIGRYVPRNEKHWKLLLLLLDLCDIIFSPTLTPNLASFLSQLIVEHHSYFKEIFPNELLLPKHHLLIHYPQCLIKSGPFVRYWCMRFEARHNFFKEIGKVSRNYKNICKTLAKRFQYALACLFMSGQLHPP